MSECAERKSSFVPKEKESNGLNRSAVYLNMYTFPKNHFFEARNQTKVNIHVLEKNKKMVALH